MYKNLVPAGALALAAVCFSFPAFPQTQPAAGEPVKAGFVYVSPITEAGWEEIEKEAKRTLRALLAAPRPSGS